MAVNTTVPYTCGTSKREDTIYAEANAVVVVVVCIAIVVLS